jgi:hypothetical protein
LEGEGGYDAKRCAGATEGPEEVGVRGGGAGEDVSGREDDGCGEEVVYAEVLGLRMKEEGGLAYHQSVFSAEIAVSAAESESSNASVVHCAADGCESVLGSFDVDVFPECAAFGYDGFGFEVDSDVAHLGEVDDKSVFDGGGTGG